VRPLSRAADRPCARPGCPSPSRATLEFSYATRTVRLASLSDERSPEAYDLCANHADRTSPPHGWELRDERQPEPEVGERPRPDQLDSPRTVAVLAAALRGGQDEDASPVLDADPLREALEELQAVSAHDPDAPLADTRPFAPRAGEDDLASLLEVLEQEARDTAATDVSDDPRSPDPSGDGTSLPPQLTFDEAVADAPREAGDDEVPGRPVLARRAAGHEPTTDDRLPEDRATAW
jgi:hypothetical protein